MGIATAPFAASAADQIITESFSVTIPGSSVPNASQPDAQFESTPFPLFAESTGLLESVAFTLTGAVKVVSLNEDPDVLLFCGDKRLGVLGSARPSKRGLQVLCFRAMTTQREPILEAEISRFELR
jgi:hypothetical protein